MSQYLEARQAGTNKNFRRVGRHKKTGQFYWYGTPYANILRKRGLLRGTVTTGEVKDFQAWCAAHHLEGKEIPHETKAQALLRVAHAEVGVKESPPESNNGPRVRQYQGATTLGAPKAGAKGYPWCAAFDVWCCEQAGIKLPREAQSASVWGITDWARKAGRLTTVAAMGDPAQHPYLVVLFSEGQHIGIVRGKTKTGVLTYEGNTSSTDGSQDNGGEVAAKERPNSAVVHIIDLSGL